MEDSLTKNNIFYNFYKNTLALKNEYKIKELCEIYNSYINNINIEKRISFKEFEESRNKGNQILNMNSNFNIILIIIYFTIIVLLLGGVLTGKSSLIER